MYFILFFSLKFKNKMLTGCPAPWPPPCLEGVFCALGPAPKSMYSSSFLPYIQARGGGRRWGLSFLRLRWLGGSAWMKAFLAHGPPHGWLMTPGLEPVCLLLWSSPTKLSQWWAGEPGSWILRGALRRGLTLVHQLQLIWGLLEV